MIYSRIRRCVFQVSCRAFRVRAVARAFVSVSSAATTSTSYSADALPGRYSPPRTCRRLPAAETVEVQSSTQEPRHGRINKLMSTLDYVLL